MSTEKNPVFVEAGKRGMRARWGPPRILRLDSLTDAQRAAVLAFVDVVRDNGTASPDAARKTAADRDGAA